MKKDRKEPEEMLNEEAAAQEAEQAPEEAPAEAAEETAAEAEAPAAEEAGEETPENAGEEAESETPEKEEKSGKGFFGRKKDKEKEALTQKVAELEDKVQRQMAEFDNYRKRTDKEKSQMFSSGERNVLEKMLPIIDNFERGFDTVEENDKEDAFVDGMRKIYAQLMKQLEDMGVTPIEATGKEFDPAFHNAVSQMESDELESGTVGMELLKGYMYHDTVLRHSMVSVVK